jgi:hypothetical protein
VNNDLHDNSNIKLLLTLTNSSDYISTGYIEFTVSGKNVYASDIDVSGSSQDVLSAGEASNVHIQLHNIGSTIAQNITGQITSSSSSIEIIDNTALLIQVAIVLVQIVAIHLLSVLRKMSFLVP